MSKEFMAAAVDHANRMFNQQFKFENAPVISSKKGTLETNVGGRDFSQDGVGMILPQKVNGGDQSLSISTNNAFHNIPLDCGKSPYITG
jgi:hypothetical protein